MTRFAYRTYHAGMKKHDTVYGMRLWRILLAAAAGWTALGAIPSLLDTASAFQRFYGFAPESALVVELFRGAWGQSLLFALGYLWAAFDPWRHAGLVALGGVGKAVYAYRLLGDVISGSGGPLALIALTGDLVFVLLFTLFLVRTGVLPSLFSPAPPYRAGRRRTETE